jgi:hypothetical protein
MKMSTVDIKTVVGDARLNVSGILWSGFIAGLIFLMLEMIMVSLFLGGSAWGPPRMIAAMVLGQGVLPPPATFALGIMVTALVIHFLLSWIYAAAFDWVFGGMRTGPFIAVGVLFGLLLYLVNFYVFTAVWPWFAEARNWVSVFVHLVYGGVLAWTYKWLSTR